jgi:DNA repair protein RecO (recombination protein O)
MRHQDEAYVLRTQELGDADLIVTLFARHQGQVRGVARSARKSRRRFGGYLEPMTVVEATWVEREGRELHRLEQIEGRRSFATMQADPLRQAACAVLAEITSCYAQEAHGEPDAFRLLGAVLESLERGGQPRLLLRYFEYWMLRIHGLLPDLARCGRCGRKLPDARAVAVAPGTGLLCDDCAATERARPHRLPPAERELLERIRRLNPTAIAETVPAPGCGAALERFLRGTLEAYAEQSFRSYRHFAAAEALDGGGGG